MSKNNDKQRAKLRRKKRQRAREENFLKLFNKWNKAGRPPRPHALREELLRQAKAVGAKRATHLTSEFFAKSQRTRANQLGAAAALLASKQAMADAGENQVGTSKVLTPKAPGLVTGGQSGAGTSSGHR